MPSRREFYRVGTLILGGAIKLGLAVPCVAYLLDPIFRKGGSGSKFDLTRLNSLQVGEPRSFPIIAEKADSWVKYPPEPIGTVWLVRQPEGSPQRVLALTGECPHVGCAIGLADGGKSFVCPCHMAKYNLKGERQNLVSPRGMDTLEVTLSEGEDPMVSVHFQRFRPQTKEKTALV
jgi:menaquinol-cytochrome c reductase iron-sulfur subunit